MPNAARVGDIHTCPASNGPIPHVGGPIVAGESTVLIEGRPAARLGDPCVCTGAPGAVVMGSVTVQIGGRPAARLGDPTAHGGLITQGAGTVLIG